MAENDTSNEDVVDIFDLKNGDPLAPVEDDSTDDKQGADPAGDTPKDPAKPDFVVPDKFKDKTFEQAIEMYTNLEQAYGRQGNEFGEVKSLAAQILQNQVAAASPAKATPAVDADTLLENPVEVINDLVSNNPVIQELAGRVVNTEKTLTVEALERKHGDLKDIGKMEGFQNWVRSNPSRLVRFQKADDGDLAEADDLVSTYKEIQAAKAERQANTRNKQRQALAVPAAGSGSSPSALNESGVKKPIFSKAQLMQLKFKDPARYERMQPQILRAYIDKRVR